MPINVHEVGTLRSSYRDGEGGVVEDRSGVTTWEGGFGFPIQRKAVWVVPGVKITFVRDEAFKGTRRGLTGLCG